MNLLSRLTVTTLCFGLCGCERNVTIIREFADGFNGAVVVVYGAPGFPPLPREHGNRVIRVPADGIVITGEPNYQGWAKVESYFVDAAGKRLRPLRRDEDAGGGVAVLGDAPGLAFYETSIGAGPLPAPERDAWLKEQEAKRRAQQQSK